ncbi:MAG TPA: UdgX family uracil-DNA binding protein [Candidatus Limnocylindrales bacterium]|jgi:DNA polymerase
MASRATGTVPDHPALAIPSRVGLDVVREVALGCRACDLWERATQTVFGEGAVPAPLMLVGEQPGDREDLAGHPFVGPAGKLLDEALLAAGIDRERVFVTNVVKHFKWRPSGKRRLHERPNPAQIRACRPWLDRELERVRPDVLVLLGATAAQSLLGSGFRVSEQHGQLLEPIAASGPRLIATHHPSSVLRSRTSEERKAGMRMLIDDLEVARRAMPA